MDFRDFKNIYNGINSFIDKKSDTLEILAAQLMKTAFIVMIAATRYLYLLFPEAQLNLWMTVNLVLSFLGIGFVSTGLFDRVMARVFKQKLLKRFWPLCNTSTVIAGLNFYSLPAPASFIMMSALIITAYYTDRRQIDMPTDEKNELK